MKKIITTLILSLMIVVGVQAQDYVVTPESGSVVESLTDITVTWPQATTIDVDPMMMVGGAKVYMVDGENRVAVSDIFCGPAWGNSVTLSLMTVTNNAGDYEIDIPDAMFTIDGVTNAAFTLSYKIAGMPTTTAQFDVTIDNGSLSTIYVTVNPCSELIINEAEEIEAPFVIYNIGFNSYAAATYSVEVTGANTATLTTDKKLENGSYTLHIPKGTFIVDGKVNPLIIRDFEATGVDVVVKENQVVDVYDLNGIRVVNKGNAQQLNSLRPGIYIVNGEKKWVNGVR